MLESDADQSNEQIMVPGDSLPMGIFVPPPRLLMGPGPISIDPRVQAALGGQLVGQFDPSMRQCMNDTMALYRPVFGTSNHWTFMVDGTARSGIEAFMVSYLRPGDSVLVGSFGRFGQLLCEIASRCGAMVHCVEAPWGEILDPEDIERAIEEIQPRLFACVQGDTSTTMLQPLGALGAICAAHDVTFYTDCTASIIGNEFLMDEWHINAATAGLQKCLGGPSGIAPITLHDSVVASIRERSKVEAGIRDQHHIDGDDLPIASNYFDLAMIMDYWSEEGLNHHTESTNMLYCARECARLVNEEGIARCVDRHRRMGQALAAGLQALGLRLFGDQGHRMNNVVGVYIPDVVDGELIREELLTLFAIEIGTSFGPLRGRIWRVGTMGYNARPDAVLQTLAALATVLARHGFACSSADAANAAMEHI